MAIINGKAIAEQIKQELKLQAANLIKKRIRPTLAVVQVGNNEASNIYIRNKKKIAEELNIKFIHLHFDEKITTNDLLNEINKINLDKTIHGLFVQLPLPKHINEFAIINAIDPNKDVDCFSIANIGRLWSAKPNDLIIKPNTPAGIIELIKRSGISLEGKNVTVIGRSNIVGKPLIALLMMENATVTVCHSKTKNLAKVCAKADILISAVGKAKLVTEDFVKKGAVVIDVGINRDESGKICGDVDFNPVQLKTNMITPVPGGVGPMTVVMLMKNLIELAKNYRK